MAYRSMFRIFPKRTVLSISTGPIMARLYIQFTSTGKSQNMEDQEDLTWITPYDNLLQLLKRT